MKEKEKTGGGAAEALCEIVRLQLVSLLSSFLSEREVAVRIKLDSETPGVVDYCHVCRC